MEKELLFEVVIPILMIIVLAYHNMKRVRRNIQKLNSRCGSQCNSCVQRKICKKEEKNCN
ncbi:MAG: hypothetical protein R3Y53_03505 [Bacillota bacterium]